MPESVYMDQLHLNKVCWELLLSNDQPHSDCNGQSLPRPWLDLSGTPGLRPISLSPGSWQTSLGLGSMSRYSAQILICILIYMMKIITILIAIVLLKMTHCDCMTTMMHVGGGICTFSRLSLAAWQPVRAFSEMMWLNGKLLWVWNGYSYPSQWIVISHADYMMFACIT